MSLVSEIAQGLRVLLESRKITQAELAKRVGVSRPMINAYLTGKRGMLLETLERVLKALDADLLMLAEAAAGRRRQEEPLPDGMTREQLRDEIRDIVEEMDLRASRSREEGR